MTKQLFLAKSAYAGVVALLISTGSHAQMQIPNPLIKPQAIKAAVASDPQNLNSPLPQGGSGMPPAPVRASVPPPVSSSDFFRSAPIVTAESKPDATVTELRQRFDAFYVSATVGDQAVLRRVSGVQPVVAQSSAAPAMAGMAKQGSAAIQSVGRAETMIIKDGEPIEFLGASVTLVPKISGGRVALYYYADAGAVSKKKRSPVVQVVFMGEVESQAPSTPAAIVLEKVDPTYKAIVSPDVKGTNTSNGSSSTNSPSMNGVPGMAPVPAY